MERVKVGVIGCGRISGAYFKSMCGLFDILEVKVCADLIPERAKASAEEYDGVESVTVDELLADPEISIVVNLTIPKAHTEVAMKAVEAGKSVYNEKPLTLTKEEAKRLLEAAAARGVLVGGAPDTFMGAGIQTCRKLLDDGCIGRPVGATAFMLSHGHESWHPDPEFYYKKGGGPMFDMGPYYLTALVALIGPVEHVSGLTGVTFPERKITSEKKYGQKIEVETPTHIAGLIGFSDGAIGTIVTSFDVWGGNVPCIEIYGTEASMSVPNPNSFGGPVKVKRPRAQEWEEMPLTHGYAENARGLGVADMAYALRSGRKHRASGRLAAHVLDVMHSFHDSSDKARRVSIESRCERPSAVPEGLADGVLDE